jgi:hypothetical protein
MVDKAALEEMWYNLKRAGKAVLTSLYRVIDYSGIIGREMAENYLSDYLSGLDLGAILGTGVLGIIEGSLYRVLLNLDYYTKLLFSYFSHSMEIRPPEPSGVGAISLYLPYIVGAARMIHAGYEFVKKVEKIEKIEDAVKDLLGAKIKF